MMDGAYGHDDGEDNNDQGDDGACCTCMVLMLTLGLEVGGEARSSSPLGSYQVLLIFLVLLTPFMTHAESADEQLN